MSLSMGRGPVCESAVDSQEQNPALLLWAIHNGSCIQFDVRKCEIEDTGIGA